MLTSNRKLRLVLFVISIFIFLFLSAFTFLAQVEPPADPSDLPAVLAWIASGAGAVFLVNWAASWLVENWTYWQMLDGRLKFAISIIVSVVLSFAAQYMLTRPDIVTFLSPYYAQLMTVILMVVGYLGGQVAHVVGNRLGYASGAKATAAKRLGR